MNQFIQSLVHLPQNYRRALVKAQGLTRGVGVLFLALVGFNLFCVVAHVQPPVLAEFYGGAVWVKIFGVCEWVVTLWIAWLFAESGRDAKGSSNKRFPLLEGIFALLLLSNSGFVLCQLELGLFQSLERVAYRLDGVAFSVVYDRTPTNFAPIVQLTAIVLPLALGAGLFFKDLAVALTIFLSFWSGLYFWRSSFIFVSFLLQSEPQRLTTDLFWTTALLTFPLALSGAIAVWQGLRAFWHLGEPQVHK